YLDASVLVSLFTVDKFTNRARSFLRSQLPPLAVSDFASAEFASAVARQVRMQHATQTLARTAFSDLDSWVNTFAQRINTISADIAKAEGYLRRLDLPLRTGEALNIAIALRIGATLATFDDTLRASARVVALAL